MMKTYKNLYKKIYDFDNLYLAWQKARKGKTRKKYVIEFEKDLERNLLDLQFELKSQTYAPLPLETFILRDPKTRKISKSDFRDRVIHHAICNILEPIFEKSFIEHSCANRKNRGTLYALKCFEKFRRKVTKNFTSTAFCLKADIKHYFEEVDHEILLGILKRKIADEEVIWLIKQILQNQKVHKKFGLLDAQDIRQSGQEISWHSANFAIQRERVIICASRKGMPLGNLTSQFFANIYLNELDYFVKHTLKAKFYIRYVDDFVILHESKEQLEKWKIEINNFLREKLKIQLHSQKSRVLPLSRGVDFVGFRNFYYFKLLRKRNIRNMDKKIDNYHKNKLLKDDLLANFQGWNAYGMWANTFELRKEIVRKIYKRN